MKKIIKTTIVVLFISIFCIYNCVYGTDLSELDGSGGNITSIKNVGADILSIVSVIASAISIIAIIVLGIKYMMGSVEEKATYKKSLLPYFIGAVFVFGATTVTSVVYKMFN